MSSYVVTRLFDEGNFSPVLSSIFRLLDGHSLESCSLVCKKWRRFILEREEDGLEAGGTHHKQDADGQK
jgi:hypothetical protein